MGLPPGNSKFSTDTNPVTTFFWNFPNFTGSHSGVTATVGINSVAGGGTGLSTLTAGSVLVGAGTSSPTLVAPGTLNNVLTSNGTTWVSQANPAGFTNPMTTTGDMIYENTVPAPARLPIGLAGQVLSVATTGPIIPQWTTLSGTTVFANYISSVITGTSSGVTSTYPTYTTFSNSPAFTITPTVTGTYKVYCNIPLETDGGNAGGIARIINTSGGATLLAENTVVSETPGGVNDTVVPAVIQSIYTLIAGTTYVFDIQGSTSAGATVVAGASIGTFYMYAEGIALSGGTLSGIQRTVQSVSTATNAGATSLNDYVYFVSGTTTLTLPTAVGNTNLYTIKNTGVNTVTIATTSAQTIDGSSTATLPVANTSLDLISDGSNWRIV